MTIGPPERAMWAAAYASVTRTKRLSPALRLAYGDGTPPLNVDAARDAVRAAEAIVAGLTEAIALAERAA